MLNISASVYVFFPHEAKDGDCMPVVDCAREIISAGIGVEIFLSEFNFEPYSCEAIEQLKEIGKNAPFLTCHTNLFRCDLDKLKAEIEMVAGFSGSILVIHPATFGFEKCDNPPSAYTLKNICKLASDSGVTLAFENSGRTGMAMMRRAIDYIGSDCLSIGMGICIDTGHANRSMENDGFSAQDYLREFRDLVVEVHINDNWGKEDLHLPPGRGNIDWNAVIPELYALNKDAAICIELARHDYEPMHAIQQSTDFLLSHL